MALRVSAERIKRLGFDWPKDPLIERHGVTEDGKVNLTKTLDALQSSRAHYRKRLNEAFNFKVQTGADYSDFTDRFDDDARAERDLAQAISYLEKIMEIVDR